VSSDTAYEGTDPDIGNRLTFGSTNFVAISHDDGTTAIYSHLIKYGALVSRKGITIDQGQPIAITGKSGWVGPNPHLHFQVIDEEYKTIPVYFEDYDGQLDHANLGLDE